MNPSQKARLTRAISKTENWRKRQRIGTLLYEIREHAGEADLRMDVRQWAAATVAISDLLEQAKALSLE